MLNRVFSFVSVEVCSYPRCAILGKSSVSSPSSSKPDFPMPWIEWYNSLAKPSWTLSPSTIGTIWQILHPIILISFGFVFVQAFRRKVPWLVALPFAINLVSNLIFTPIQFGMRNLPLAAVDILVVWATIIWMMVVVWRNDHWVALSQNPYFVRVSLATVLQFSITAMNWGMSS